MDASTIDCPICLSEIEGVSNIVTTDCGHSFHCSCLMRNVLANGFSCPCCRTSMAPVAPVAVPVAAPVAPIRLRITVKRATIGGMVVLIDSINVVYNINTREEMGMWNNETKTLSQYDDLLEVWIPVWFDGQGMAVPMGYLF